VTENEVELDREIGAVLGRDHETEDVVDRDRETADAHVLGLETDVAIPMANDHDQSQDKSENFEF
jgi:hypothetical protein